MIEAEKAAVLREQVALWMVEPATVDGMLATASELSAAPHASREVVDLACLYASSPRWQLKEAADRALLRMGLTPIEVESDVIAVLVLRVRCRDFLAGHLAPRQLLRLAYDEGMYYGAYDVAQEFADLYDLAGTPGWEELEERDGLLPFVLRFMGETADL